MYNRRADLSYEQFGDFFVTNQFEEIEAEEIDMATRINPPQYNKDKSYERYKTELMAWEKVTDVKDTKRSIVVALSLPENEESGIRERVFDELDLNDLNKENGLEILVTFMDGLLGKDDLADSLGKFEDFEEYKREPDQSMADFISKYDQKHNKLIKLKMGLPPAIVAFMLLKKANLTKAERMLVLTGMNYSEKDQLFEQAKKSLLKFKGEQVGTREGSGASAAIKLEPTYVADSEEAFWNARYSQKSGGRGYQGGGARPWQRGQGRPRGGNQGNYRGHQNHYSQTSDRASDKNKEGKRAVNPTGFNGAPMLCKSCGSYRHLIKDCPDSYENQASANITEQGNYNPDANVWFSMMLGDEEKAEDVVFLTGFNKCGVRRFGEEARKCAVLDSACTSTVCGEAWMDDYLTSLSPADRRKVTQCESKKVFKFGGGERLKSGGTFTIPAYIVGKEKRIRTDVVRSDIPLLLSKGDMKAAEIKLDLQNDTAEIYGVRIFLNETSSGHYCIPIDIAEETTVETVCVVNI